MPKKKRRIIKQNIKKKNIVNVPGQGYKAEKDVVEGQNDNLATRFIRGIKSLFKKLPLPQNPVWIVFVFLFGLPSSWLAFKSCNNDHPECHITMANVETGRYGDGHHFLIWSGVINNPGKKTLIIYRIKATIILSSGRKVETFPAYIPDSFSTRDPTGRIMVFTDPIKMDIRRTVKVSSDDPVHGTLLVYYDLPQKENYGGDAKLKIEVIDGDRLPHEQIFNLPLDIDILYSSCIKACKFQN